MEKYDFIKLMLKSRNLSVNDKKRLVLLATQEIERKDVIVKVSETNNTVDSNSAPRKQVHAPKDTASFLSLFNDPNGFKFLTHDFDPDSEMDYDKLMKQTRGILLTLKGKYNIPSSLYAIMNAMLWGGKKEDGTIRTWTDSENKSHQENYATKSWVEWAEKNPKVHLLSNEEFSNVILKFRSTIRLVKPTLADIINIQKVKHADLNIQSEGLEKADFYTYVLKLVDGIKRILDDMSRYSSKTPNVIISFDRKYNDDYSSRIIKITQIESVSSSLDDVLMKYHDEKGGGAFNEIKKVFLGYCNWSVEALWDGKPKRWNILTDEKDIPEVEDIEKTNILGFTHVLTYFSK